PEHLAAASRRRPDVHWRLLLLRAGSEPERHVGGRFPGSSPPRVWLLGDAGSSDLGAARAVVDRLGWPHEVRRPGATGPPWPGLVLASGRGGAGAARELRARSAGRTRVVLVGEEEGARAGDFDLAVTPVSAGFFPHARRFETLGPLLPPAD